MATVIEFSGDEGHWIVVEEDVEAVHEAVAVAGTQAVRFTHQGQDEPVYVNPAQIACWYPGVAGESAQTGRFGRSAEAYRPPRGEAGHLRRAILAALDLEAADVRHGLK